jgi:hypothetical protein
MVKVYINTLTGREVKVDINHVPSEIQPNLVEKVNELLDKPEILKPKRLKDA